MWLGLGYFRANLKRTVILPEYWGMIDGPGSWPALFLAQGLAKSPDFAGHAAIRTRRSSTTKGPERHVMACQYCTIAAIADVGTGAGLTVVGMIVVFTTLAVLGGVISFLSRWLKRPPQAVDGIDSRIIAVLTAAAMAATMKPVQLRQVELIDNDTPAKGPGAKSGV